MKTLERSLALLLALGSLASCEIILRRSDGTRAVDGRYMHTALWTGKEMLVGGGSGGGGGGPDCEDGCDVWSLYDPATNAWRTTHHKLSGGRRDHSAVWTGTEMIVWGGQVGRRGVGGDEPSAGGLRYNPSTNWWSTTSGKGAPSPRLNHTAIWTGSEMIVWGGRDSPQSSAPLGGGARYNPKSDTWTPVTAGVARESHAAIWTGSEMIVWGGSLQGATSGARYNPATDSWVALASTGQPDLRRKLALVWTGKEMIVAGGEATEGPSFSNLAAASYDPATDSWRAIAAPKMQTGTVPWFPAAAWTGSELVLWREVGGARYLPTKDAWETFTPKGEGVVVPNNLDGMSAVWTGSEVIFWGGAVFSGGNPSGEAHRTGLRYNPATGTWRPTAVVMPDEWD